MYVLLGFLLLMSAVPAHAGAELDPVFGRIDLAFERNEGQADPRVKFLARSQGYSVFLTANEAVMRFATPRSSVIGMTFLGQTPNAEVEGLDALPGTTNYFLGNGSLSKTDIRSYRKVRYSEIYPGIDVEYHGDGRLLEYDFVVHPGSNPSEIRIGFSGVRGMSLDASGDLVLETEADQILQKKPRVYQRVDGREQMVDAAYVIHEDHVGFNIAGYDKTKPLIIDPVLVYSTFFGGTGIEIAYGIAVDPQGGVYVTGVTTSTDFPIQSAAQSEYNGGSTDGFVFKLDPTGTQLVYSTFFGGSGTDEGHSIAVDAGGNAYVTGFTQSSDFPVAGGFQGTRGGGQEGYFLKLNSSGTAIVYSTFLGGSSDDRGIAIAVDAGNNAYITGTTSSTNFPTANAYRNNNAGGFADGFVSKISSGGTLVYSTYVGGIGNDNPLGIAVDGSGAAYVTGWTTSIDFPLVNALQTKFGGFDEPIGTDDVFVFKLNPGGTGLDYSTYVGGTGSDEGTRITVDSSGSVYVTGYTGSLTFPTANAYQPLLSNFEFCALSPDATCFDAFVFKLSPDGKSLVFSTYFGGFQIDSGTGVAVDASGAVYLSGFTTSFDLPTANQIQGFIGGNRDAFVAKFDPAGNILVFSTFFGGSGTDGATGLTLDAAGNAYVVGFTTSTDLQTVDALQPGNAGVPEGADENAVAQDVFVAKLNVADIVSSSEFQVAPQGASSVVTKGTRTDAVFGYAVAEPAVPGTQLTGLALINLRQSGATVTEVGVPAPAFIQVGRLFVDVRDTGRTVLSIANPSDEDASIDFFYTNQAGETTQFVTVTVKAREHFSRFITDDPLSIFTPGTLNFTSSIPIIATAFLTEVNESSELLISHTPIVDPVAHELGVGGKTITIPEFAEGGGWRNDVILVNTTEARMNGEVRFFSQGSGDQPGVPTEVGIGDEGSTASVLEFDIPPRGFQKISTAGNHTISEMPFALNRATSFRTPGAGPFQITGWASADSADANARLNGLQIIENRQLGITQGQVGIAAPSLRQTGRFFAEVTDTARSFMAVANPNNEDVTLEVILTDESGTTTDPVTLTIPAAGQLSQFLSDQPVSLAAGSKRTVSFSASLPVFVTALRFFTNERNDAFQSVSPIAGIGGPVDQPLVIPHFADGAGWKTRVILVNNTDEEMRGEIRFLSPGGSSVTVGVDSGDSSSFEYGIQPRGFFDLQTNGLMENLSSGSVHVLPFGGFHTPAAHAVLSDFIVDEAASELAGQTVGNTIFETSIAGRLPAANLRFYAEAVGDFDAAKFRSIRTSIAIANPSNEPAAIQLEVVSFDGARLGLSSEIAIPASGQFAAYLLQIAGLESVPVPFQGEVRLNVLSGSGVTASSFRILRNERLDYMVTTTGPLDEDAGMSGRLIFPYVTDSTGYTTQFVLINPPGVENSSGTLRYLATDGSALPVDALKLGSIQIVPFGGFNTPHAHVVLFHREAGLLTSILGIEGQLPGAVFRMYAESTGEFEAAAGGSIRSGIALANPSASPATVILEVRNLDGALLRTSQPLAVPPNGQVALFLNQIPGLENLAIPFEGVLRVAATSAEGVTASGLRAFYNERGNTVFTTTGPLIENAGTPDQLVFPHIAEGGGYTTQFIVISGSSGQANEGVLRFFTGEGNPLNVTLTTR